MVRLTTALLLIIISVGSYLAFANYEPDAEPATTIEEPETVEWVMDDSLAAYLNSFESSFVEGLNSKGIPGASVVIVKDGRIVFEKGFGVIEKGSDKNVNEHTIFRLGSVSKGFASVLTGMFVEDGVVRWDSPVTSYLDQFRLNDPDQTQRVQVRHLLSHTSGLPRHAYTNLVEDGLSLDRIIPRLERVPLIAREGEQLSYQNAAYSTIEKVLESETGKGFDILLNEKIFEPLEMEQASASYDGISKSDNRALPHIYYSRSRGYVPIRISKKYYNAVSSGGINASASDMGRWLLLLTGQHPDIISDETLNEIFDPLASINNRRFSRHWSGVNQSHYGLGWRVLDNHGQRVVYHGGYVNGFRSEIAFAPDDDLGICILTNANSSYPLTVIPDLFNHFKNESDTDIDVPYSE